MCYVRLDLAHQPYYQKELERNLFRFSTHLTPKKTMTRAQWCLTPQGIHSFIHSWLHQKNNSVLFPISAFLPGSSLGTWQEGMSWTWEACLAAWFSSPHLGTYLRTANHQQSYLVEHSGSWNILKLSNQQCYWQLKYMSYGTVNLPVFCYWEALISFFKREHLKLISQNPIAVLHWISNGALFTGPHGSVAV